MPDGKNVRFPDDMPSEQIKSLIIQKFPNLGQTVEEKETVNLQPLTEDQKAKSKMDSIDIANEFIGDFAKGTYEGSKNAIQRAVNGATLGLYDRLDTALGGDSVELKKRLQSEADATGFGDFHRNADAVAEFAGSIYPAAKTYQLASKFTKGVGALATSGAIEESLRKMINSDSLDEAGYDGLVGAITGGVTGGSLGLAGKLMKGAWYLGKNSAQKALTYLKNEVGEETLNGFINKAKEEGRSILEVVNEKTASLLRSAQKQSPEAKEIVSSRIDDIAANSADKAEDLLENVLGKDQGWKTALEVKKAADYETKSAFDALNSAGDLARFDKSFEKFVKDNDLYKQAIKEVRKDVSLPKALRDQKQTPDTDFRILEAAREKLREMSNMAASANNLKKADRITKQTNDLLSRMDELLPEYKGAREIYQQAREIGETVKKGGQIFNRGVNPEKFAEDFNNLNQHQKDAYKLGLRDEVVKIIGGKSENNGWKSFLPKNVQSKIKTVLGKENGQKLIDFAREELKRVDILKASKNISSEASNKFPYIYTNPANQAVDILSRIQGIGKKQRNVGLAELLTSPEAEAMKKAIKDYEKGKFVKANKYLQEKLGKDYLPISVLLGVEEFNRNNKF